MRQKKLSIFMCMLVSILGSMITVQSVKAERAIDVARKNGHNLEDQYQPAGSIITEINTGQILWQDNAQVSWAPASMTKLMTILLAYDAMAGGAFQLDTQVAVTEKYLDIAGRYSLSNNAMKRGVSYTVSELIDLIIVPSSAAATFMLADMVEPDPDKFAALMNEKAALLGMTQTTYYNAVGIPNKLLVPYQPVNQSLENNNVTSPRDYALLCSYFVKTYPDILNHTNDVQIVIKQGTIYEEHFTSYQISLEGAKYGIEGVDGLKTGSSGEAGFNYSATGKRGDTRLIEVVMGVSSWEDQAGEEIRHLVGNSILEQAFEKYEYRVVLQKGTHVIDGKEIVLETDLWDCVPKNQELDFIIKEGMVQVDQECSYLPGYQPPKATYRLASEVLKDEDNNARSRNVFAKIVLGIVTVFVILVIGRAYYCIHKDRKMRQRRKLQRRKEAEKSVKSRRISNVP